MKSIQARLSLGLVAVLVVVGVVLAQLTLWLFEAGLQRYLENGLRNESENLLVALVRGPSGLQLDERRISAAYQRPFSGYYFRIDFDQGTWRSRSLWDLDMPKPAAPGLPIAMSSARKASNCWPCVPTTGAWARTFRSVWLRTIHRCAKVSDACSRSAWAWAWWR